MRLIDADKLLEETRKDRDYAEKNGFLDMYYERQVLIDRIESQPTAYDVNKVVEEIKTLKEEALGEYNMGEYNLDNNIGNSIAENYRKDMNEGKCFAYDEAIEIVKQEAEQYEECYNDCGDCEAYNEEK